MARLLLTTEGQTEQVFATRVLAPHLAEINVFVPNPRCAAIAKKRGQIHRGGVLGYQPLREDILAWLKQDRDPTARFSTMIDLYGLPNDFPGQDAASGVTDPYKRVALIEAAFISDIKDRRFIPYIQLHEFESLLFADPTKLSEYYPEHADEIGPLAEVATAVGNPELIDEGKNSAPSKRIIACIPEYRFAKPTAGPIVAEAIGLPTLRKSCQHFNEWLEKLEALGTQTESQS